MNKDLGTPGVIAPPPLLLALSLLAGFSLGRLAPLGILAAIPTEIRYWLGGIVIVMALTLSLLGFTKFTREGTPVNPARSPAHLVTSGIFAHMRNPMYVSFYVLSVGVAILSAADWVIPTTVLLALLIHFGVVRREERYLETRFGDDYLRYKNEVPRYFWRL